MKKIIEDVVKNEKNKKTNESNKSNKTAKKAPSGNIENKTNTPKMIVEILILLTVLNGSIILTLHNFCNCSPDALEVNLDSVDVAPLALVDLTITTFTRNRLRVLKQGIRVAYRTFFYQ